LAQSLRYADNRNLLIQSLMSCRINSLQRHRHQHSQSSSSDRRQRLYPQPWGFSTCSKLCVIAERFRTEPNESSKNYPPATIIHHRFLPTLNRTKPALKTLNHYLATNLPPFILGTANQNHVPRSLCAPDPPTLVLPKCPAQPLRIVLPEHRRTSDTIFMRRLQFESAVEEG